jgi:hypothetical protein
LKTDTYTVELTVSTWFSIDVEARNPDEAEAAALARYRSSPSPRADFACGDDEPTVDGVTKTS